MTSEDRSTPASGEGALLPRHLCRVMGVNQNFTSRCGTPYHMQIEDRGPVFDDLTEAWVRRVNVIAYANYGEATARIVHGRDHDLPDIRTHAHNREITQRIQEFAAEARQAVEDKEERHVARIQNLLRRYYDTRDESIKREFEEANALFPFVFARAFQELKAERVRAAEAAAVSAQDAAREAATQVDIEETVYPLDPGLRNLVLEIERMTEDLKRDVATLKAHGAADDILQASCTKLLSRARESLTRRHNAEFATRHLEMTRNSLVTVYRQVRARVARLNGA